MLLTDEHIKEIENGIKFFYRCEEGKTNKKALIIGINNPLYKFINAVVEMNKINFEKLFFDVKIKLYGSVYEQFTKDKQNWCFYCKISASSQGAHLRNKKSSSRM